MSIITRMVRRSFALACSLVASGAGLVGCAGASDSSRDTQGRILPRAQAQPVAPEAAGALTQIADTAAARRRLAYVNLVRLAEVRPAVAPGKVLRRLLGDVGAQRLLARWARTAVQVGGATVLRGPPVQDLARAAGQPARSGGVVFGGDAALRRTLADPRPEVNAIAPGAQSAVQSCLGDTAAQTIVGPAVMDRDGAIGAGLRATRDRPAGVQLAICFAPRLRREIHAAQRRIERRYAAALSLPRERRPVIGELEIGEREMLSAVLPADAVDERELLALLGGGRALRRLGGHG